MINGIVLRVVVAVVSIVLLVTSWVQTGTPAVSVLSSFSTAVFASLLVLFIWDKWLWKNPLIQKITGVPRDMSGTWQATLETRWVDPATGLTPVPKTVYVVIRQTSSTITVTLISNESKSKSSLARVVVEDDSWLIHYIYTNQPRLNLRKGSPIHHGSGVLAAAGNPVVRIDGGYWTDRDTQGSLSLGGRSRTYAEDFEGAEELFSKP